MRRTTFVGAMMMVAALGCGKKPEKKDAGPDTTPPPQVGSIGVPGPAPAPAPTPGVLPSGGAGGGVVLNPQGAVGGGGGGGAVQAVRKAAKRPVDLNDLKQIQLFIDTASGASGTMPTVKETYAAIKQEAPKIAAMIDEGAIVLNPARTREDVWAYQAAALEFEGWVLTSSGVEKMEARTLRTRLGM
jgi:hypothetical protein